VIDTRYASRQMQNSSRSSDRDDHFIVFYDLQIDLDVIQLSHLYVIRV
jgi:hypothetical protein